MNNECVTGLVSNAWLTSYHREHFGLQVWNSLFIIYSTVAVTLATQTPYERLNIGLSRYILVRCQSNGLCIHRDQD